MMIRGSARRAFLRGAGLGAFALPFLRSLSVRGAPADARRLVVFATPNGTVMSEFFPDATNGYKRILKPLEALKPKLLVMRGIHHESAYKTPIPPNHEPDNPNMLTARQSTGQGAGQMAGISIDQHVANAILGQTRFASLQLGARVLDYCGIISSRGKGLGIFPDNDPYRAFTRLFQDAVAAPADLSRLRQERKSIMDALVADVADLRCALGSAERPKLDAHLESIRELERSLQAPAATGCTPPVQGARVELTKDNYPTLLKLQMDITVAALACDLTRVITLQAQSGASPAQFPWLSLPYSHHGIAHGSEGVTASTAERTEWLIQIETWYAQQFQYLLGKLDAIDDRGGSLLDHSTVLWAHEQSNGADHSRRDMPYVLAGGSRGAFRLGRSLNLGGKPHNGLLIALANASGVPTPSFGDPDFSKGPLPDL